MVEIYVHTTERKKIQYRVRDYEKYEINFIDVDTTTNARYIFLKIINHSKQTTKIVIHLPQNFIKM